MCAKGEAMPRDFTEAVKWYRKAAEQNDSSAQFSLGVMYHQGAGILKDEVEALAWFKISAAAGDKSAIEACAILEPQLGVQLTLMAQQRCKKILNEIEAAKIRGSSSNLVGPRGKC
jgi:TPR repeat protein